LAEPSAAAVVAPARTRPRAKPRPKPRTRKRRRARSHGAIAWIVISAVLLAGVVFVNLAVLQLNLGLDKATQERTNLRANNALLQSQLSAKLSTAGDFPRRHSALGKPKFFVQGRHRARTVFPLKSLQYGGDSDTQQQGEPRAEAARRDRGSAARDDRCDDLYADIGIRHITP